MCITFQLILQYTYTYKAQFTIYCMTKHIHLNLKDEEFFKILKIKNDFQQANLRKFTWEEIVMLMTIRTEVNKANGNNKN